MDRVRDSRKQSKLAYYWGSDTVPDEENLKDLPYCFEWLKLRDMSDWWEEDTGTKRPNEVKKPREPREPIETTCFQWKVCGTYWRVAVN